MKVKVTITTPDGEVLDTFLVLIIDKPANWSDRLAQIQMATNIRDTIERRLDTQEEE